MPHQTIVVTNDDPDFLEMMEELLAEEGYQRVFCALSTSADETILRAQPDLVLVDIHQARPAAGWQLLERMRSDPATATIPIIICTTTPRLFEAPWQQLQDRNCDILEKPFMIEDLLAKVQAKIGPPAPGRPGCPRA